MSSGRHDSPAVDGKWLVCLWKDASFTHHSFLQGRCLWLLSHWIKTSINSCQYVLEGIIQAAHFKIRKKFVEVMQRFSFYFSFTHFFEL